MEEVLRDAGVDPALFAGLSLEDGDASPDDYDGGAADAVGSDDEALLAEFEREQGGGGSGSDNVAATNGDSAQRRPAEPASVAPGPPGNREDTVAKRERDAEDALAAAQRRALEYKKSALAHKERGDRTTAVRHLAIAKRIGAAIGDGRVPRGSDLPPHPDEWVPPPAPGGSAGAASSFSSSSTSSHTAGSPGSSGPPRATSRPLPTAAVMSPEESRARVFELIGAALGAEAASASREAEEAHASADHAAALECHARLERARSDAARLKALERSGGAPPRYSVKTNEKRIERTIPGIAPGELRVTVGKVGGGAVASGGAAVYASIEVDHPSREDPQRHETPYATGNSKSKGEPDLSAHAAKFRVERRAVRGTASGGGGGGGAKIVRHLARRRVSGRLFLRRWLRSGQPLGRFELKLEGLETSCDVVARVDLLDESRRPTGVWADVKAELRTPAGGSEVTTIRETAVEITWDAADDAPSTVKENDGGGDPSAASPSKAGPTTESTAAVEAPGESAESRASAAPVPSTEAGPSPSAGDGESHGAPATSVGGSGDGGGDGDGDGHGGAPEEDQDLVDPDDVDRMVSNNVMEAELEASKAEIAKCRAKGLTPPSEVSERVDLLNIKLECLVIEVQTGSLTVEGYLSRIRDALRSEISIAKKLKAAGDARGAWRVLQRVKIMKAEIEEASEQ